MCVIPIRQTQSSIICICQCSHLRNDMREFFIHILLHKLPLYNLIRGHIIYNQLFLFFFTSSPGFSEILIYLFRNDDLLVNSERAKVLIQASELAEELEIPNKCILLIGWQVNK